MATFTTLLEQLRRDILGEPDATYSSFDDANDLLPALYQASAEIASFLAFPVATDATRAAASGATSFSAPADMVWPESLTVKGDELELKDYATVRRKQKLTGETWTRYYSFDPKRGSTIELGPPLSSAASAGDIVVEYVKAIDTSVLTTASSAWSGYFTDWHWLIPYRAAVRVFDSVGEAESSQYYSKQFNAGLQAFAARLGRTNIANLTIPPEARDDEGEL